MSIKAVPTHYSELDVKTMKITDLRIELEARGLASKGEQIVVFTWDAN